MLAVRQRREVLAATLPTKLMTECFCASCGEKVTPTPTVDPFAICLECVKGHRFFVMPEGPLYNPKSAKPASAQFPEVEGRSREQIAIFWLSDPVARGILNQQLAELLRTILEPRSIDMSFRFAYCPLCASRVSGNVGNDAWVDEIHCLDGHRWGERSGNLSHNFEGTWVRMQAERTDDVVRGLVTAWLTDRRVLKPYLHHTVRRVLEGSVFGRGVA